MDSRLVKLLILVLALAAILTAASIVLAEQTPWMHVPDTPFDQGWGFLDLERLYDAGHLQQEDTLTGSWGGWRHRLYEAGISILASYDTELDANPVGGKLHKVRYVDTIGVAAFLDLERLFNFKDTFLLVSMADRNGSSLSSDIPNFFPVQQLYGGETIRMDHFVLEKNMLEGRLDVVGGRLNALDDFAASNYFCYAQNNGICGSPFSLEVNAALSNYPLASWGTRARFDITSDFYSMTGAYNTYPNFAQNKFHGVDFSIRHNSGVAILQEFGYRPRARRKAGYPGFIKIGGFYDSEPRPAFAQGGNINSNWTIYGIAQQRLFKRHIDGFGQGLEAFLTFTYSPPSMNTVQYFGDLGLMYLGLFPSRPNDALGIFGIYGAFSPDMRDAQRAAGVFPQSQEAVAEFNYKFQLTPFSYFQPDIQYVIRPNGTGTIPNALVFAIGAGMRF